MNIPPYVPLNGVKEKLIYIFSVLPLPQHLSPERRKGKENE